MSYNIDVCVVVWQAYSFMSGNKMHIFVLNSIGSFLLFLGKLSITAVACTVAVFWLRVSDLGIVDIWCSVFF